MVNKGQYYKIKTKEYLVKKGYQVEYLEKLQRIYIPEKKQVLFTKKDIFGADLVAMNENEIIFVNSKTGKSNISTGIKEFMKFRYPKFVKRWLVVWTPKIREPEIVEVQNINEKNIYLKRREEIKK